MTLRSLSLFHWLRRTVRESPWLFRMRLRLRRRPLRSLYPDSDADIFVTGYPRSANSFTLEWLQRCYPEFTFASHMHTIASLKDAQRNGVPTIVLVREPGAAIASALIKRRVSPRRASGVAKVYIDDYIAYYRYVEEHPEAFLPVPFNTAIRDQRSVVRMVNTHFGLQLPFKQGSLEKAVGEAVEFIKADGRNPTGDARDPGQRNFGNPDKERRKRGMINLVRSQARFAHSDALYLTLVERNGLRDAQTLEGE